MEQDAGGRAIAGYRSRFGGDPELLARAPGRVNLIGEHTDYHEGLVLPMAIDRSVALAFSPRQDGLVRIRAIDSSEEASFDLDSPGPGEAGFSAYVRGAAAALASAGVERRGIDGALAGDVPIGAGLSSSAALAVAAILALAAKTPAPLEIARIARCAENEHVGVPCGLMDPAVSAGATAGHAFLLDCRTCESRPVSLPDGLAVVLLDTGTRRRLADSRYQERRRECDEAARVLGVPFLRDASPADLAGLSGVGRRRAQHFVSENARVSAFVGALRHAELGAAGRLLDASHESLRTDFDVSSAPLDAIVSAAQADPACLGARLTGAGFAGFAVALVRAGEETGFGERVVRAYRDSTGRAGAAWRVRPVGGASLSRP